MSDKEIKSGLVNDNTVDNTIKQIMFDNTCQICPEFEDHFCEGIIEETIEIPCGLDKAVEEIEKKIKELELILERENGNIELNQNLIKENEKLKAEVDLVNAKKFYVDFDDMREKLRELSILARKAIESKCHLTEAQIKLHKHIKNKNYEWKFKDIESRKQIVQENQSLKQRVKELEEENKELYHKGLETVSAELAKNLQAKYSKLSEVCREVNKYAKEYMKDGGYGTACDNLIYWSHQLESALEEPDKETMIRRLTELGHI